MSFPALFLACQAAEVYEPPEDDEFGMYQDYVGELDVRWALYRSEGAGLVFGVVSVDEDRMWVL